MIIFQESKYILYIFCCCCIAIMTASFVIVTAIRIVNPSSVFIRNYIIFVNQLPFIQRGCILPSAEILSGSILMLSSNQPIYPNKSWMCLSHLSGCLCLGLLDSTPTQMLLSISCRFRTIWPAHSCVCVCARRALVYSL